MRSRICVLLWLGALAGCVPPWQPAPLPQGVPAPAEGSVSGPRLPQLRDELLAMRAAFTSTQPPDPERLSALVARIQAVDSLHLLRLGEIVREHGWPDGAMVGTEGLEAVFLLVQHADRDVAFQKEYLARLEGAFRAGDLDRQAVQGLALLTDRVRTNQGRPQLYGTQVEIHDGRVVVHPIEDEPNVDVRRAELGLPPLAEYLRILEEHYGRPR
jgi:hypothetical protein